MPISITKRKTLTGDNVLLKSVMPWQLILFFSVRRQATTSDIARFCQLSSTDSWNDSSDCKHCSSVRHWQLKSFFYQLLSPDTWHFSSVSCHALTAEILCLLAFKQQQLPLLFCQLSSTDSSNLSFVSSQALTADIVLFSAVKHRQLKSDIKH